MKVLFMSNIPSPYRVDFFNEFGKFCDLTVTFEGKNATDRDVKWKSGKISTFHPIFLNGIRTGTDKFLCLEILKILKKNFDHIIVGGYSTPTAMLAIEYMRLNKISFWIEADGGLIVEENYFKYKIKRHFISSAEGWFSSGQITSDYFLHYGAQKEKIYRYPFTSLREQDILDAIPGVEEKRKLRNELEILDRKEENKIAISVGRFIYGKGFDILLKAWVKCPKTYQLYIVGGSATQEYLELKKELGLDNVHFVEFKEKKVLIKYYQAADLLVFPTRKDIWGLVINEAMANGLPVITTNQCVAGLELIKEGGSGYIVPVENHELLAKKIITLLDDDKMREKFSRESLTIIKKYTIEEMAQSHIKILKDAQFKNRKQ